MPTEPPLELGVLDLGEYTATLAPLAESLGYSRYWIAEHHGGSPAAACPELLIPIAASGTKRIRVGTGGVLLKFYSPLKVAETFGALDSLFPGRIDIGIAGGGTDPSTTKFLLDGRPRSPDYREKLLELAKILQSPNPANPEKPLVSTESGLWVLGSRSGSALLAAEVGASYAHALFLASSLHEPASFQVYRDRYCSLSENRSPTTLLAFGGICAETGREAEKLASEHRNPFLVPNVVGIPEDVREFIESLRDKYATNEFLFLDLSPSLAYRQQSYSLLSEALELNTSWLPY